MTNFSTTAPRKAIRGDPATTYARRVVAGKIVTGPWVRAACQRHLNDLEHGHKRGLRWDRKEANRVIGYFERVLTLPGRGRRRPFVLSGWQCFVVGSIFGWFVRNTAERLEARGGDVPDADRLEWVRRFLTAYVEVGKGAGKTPLAAGIGLYMMASDGEPEAEVYAAATNKDQAKLCFRDAKRMRAASRDLRSRTLATKEAITHLKSESIFVPVSADGSGLDGKRIHCAIVDELQEHPDSTVVDKLTDGVKGRLQPLIFEITNSGHDRNSVAGKHRTYSELVLSGKATDDEWFAYVCSLDDGDDPLINERCWIKANPNLGISITKRYLRKQVREARQMPGRLGGVLRVNFCVWTHAASPIFLEADWRACQRPIARAVLEELLKGRNCVGGLDLAGANDLAALVLLFELEGLDLPGLELDLSRRATAIALPYYWTPEHMLEDRAQRDSVPYVEWVEKGYLNATPGRSIDYAFIAEELGRLAALFSIDRIAYDPYRIKYLERDIQNAGVVVKLVPHGQGYFRSQESLLWMPHSVGLLEQHVAGHTTLFAESPVMTWNAQSAVLVADAKGNRIFDKRKATGRIDGLVAAAMAEGTRDATPPDPVKEFLAHPIMVS